MKYFKLNFLFCHFLFGLIYSPCCNAVKLSCSGDFRLEARGPSQGSSHQDVERSGVVLVKDYGVDQSSHSGSRYAVILGHDSQGDFWNFQAGKCEHKHKYTSETARDELKEETGGAVKMGAREISNQPYIYSAQKQLFFIRNDQLDIKNLKNSVLKTRNNPNLPYCEREIDDIEAVSLPHFLQTADHVRQNKIHQSRYLLTSLTGKKINIDSYYFRMIAHKLPEVRLVLDKLFPGKSQVNKLPQSKTIQSKNMFKNLKNKRTSLKAMIKNKYKTSFVKTKASQKLMIKKSRSQPIKISHRHKKKVCLKK